MAARLLGERYERRPPRGVTRRCLPGGIPLPGPPLTRRCYPAPGLPVAIPLIHGRDLKRLLCRWPVR